MFSRPVITYLAVKFMVHLLSAVILAVLVFGASELLVDIFTFNARWIGGLLTLPLYVVEWLVGIIHWDWLAERLGLMFTVNRGVAQAYDAFVTLIHTVAEIVPAPYGQQAEAGIRAVLPEGWIVILEISLLIRLTFAAIRPKRKYRWVKQRIGSQNDDLPTPSHGAEVIPIRGRRQA